jgi:catechol-2,3-dioxygenase
LFSTGYAEIVLIVKDVLKSAEFYRKSVGLKPMSEPNEEWAWFFVDGERSREKLALHKGRLLFEEYSPHPEGDRWGHIHFALNVPPAKLSEAIAHLEKYNVVVYGPKEFEWMNATAYYFYDPDGNLIEYWSESDKD